MWPAERVGFDMRGFKNGERAFTSHGTSTLVCIGHQDSKGALAKTAARKVGLAVALTTVVIASRSICRHICGGHHLSYARPQAGAFLGCCVVALSRNDVQRKTFRNWYPSALVNEEWLCQNVASDDRIQRVIIGSIPPYASNQLFE